MGFKVYDAQGALKAPLAGTPMLLGADPWHLVGGVGEPAFQNGWVNFGAGQGVARFRKYPDGRVRLAGQIKSGTAGSVAFTLPVGYWPGQPPGQGQFFVGRGSGGVVALVSVSATGAVAIDTGGNTQIVLDGIEFDTETVVQAPVMFGVPLVTSLAGLAPVEGMVVDYRVVPTTIPATTRPVVWRLRYSAVDVAWLPTGPTPIEAGVWVGLTGATTITSTSFADLPASPISVSAPLAGDYEIQTFATMDAQADGQQNVFSFKRGAVVATDADSIAVRTVNFHSVAGLFIVAGVAAGDAFPAQAKVTTSGGRVFNRAMRLTPLKVTG